jgi:hypothetical protein
MIPQAPNTKVCDWTLLIFEVLNACLVNLEEIFWLFFEFGMKPTISYN